MGKRQTRMVRCPHPGCFDLMPDGATGCNKHKKKLCADCKRVEVFHPFTFCPVCIAARKKERTARFNASRAVNRRCACGCGRKAAPRSKYAAECSEGIGKEKKAFRNRAQAKQNNKIQGTLTPRVPTPIVMTSEQIDAECRKAEAELSTRRERLNPQLLALRTCRGAVALVGV